MSLDKRRFRPGLLKQHALGLRLAVLAAVTLGFTLILYPSLMVSRHEYHIGDVAAHDVKAPRDFLVEDQTATEIKRQQAVQEVLTVYDEDPELSARLAGVVEEAFADMRALQQAAIEAERLAADRPVAAASSAGGKAAPRPLASEDRRKLFEDKLGVRISRGAFIILENDTFSRRVAEVIADLLKKAAETGIVSTKESQLKDFERGVVLRDVRNREEKVVRDFKHFYSLDQARSLVRATGQQQLRDLDYGMTNLAVDFAQRMLQPNITLNRNETEQRKSRATADVKPVLYKIKQGEMLLREGERVNDLQLLKLQALQSQSPPEQVLLGVIGAGGLMFCLIVVSYCLFFRRILLHWPHPTKNIVFMACVFLLFQLATRIGSSFLEAVLRNSQLAIPDVAGMFLVPMVAGPMIVCIFLDLAAAMPFAVVTAVAAALVFKNSLAVSMYFLVTGGMGAYWIRTCRERKVFVTAGAKTGLLGAVLAVGVNFFAGHVTWPELIWSSAFAFLGGFGAGVVAAGLAPLAEIAFGYTTDTTLLELANLDRPILRQLMIEAPGTYHHSVILGSMVEAAAAEIGANPLLAKVTGYYHDIGKIKKPQYFIENIRNSKNKHDKLAPSMSALILISHIKEGVEIAREQKLAQAIIDGIRQHHGTSLIRYFYDKARQMKGEDAVKEEDFRYPGPKPQTREAALVMLADVVEAASRTLENPTPARIKGLVHNLFNRILADGQLAECEITLKDLNQIAASFNTILNGIHHHRIEYFDQRSAEAEAVRSRSKNGYSDRQPPKAAADPSGQDTPGSPHPVTRLRAS